MGCFSVVPDAEGLVYVTEVSVTVWKETTDPAVAPPSLTILKSWIDGLGGHVNQLCSPRVRPHVRFALLVRLINFHRVGVQLPGGSSTTSRCSRTCLFTLFANLSWVQDEVRAPRHRRRTTGSKASFSNAFYLIEEGPCTVVI